MDTVPKEKKEEILEVIATLLIRECIVNEKCSLTDKNT